MSDDDLNVIKCIAFLVGSLTFAVVSVVLTFAWCGTFSPAFQPAPPGQTAAKKAPCDCCNNKPTEVEKEK